MLREERLGLERCYRQAACSLVVSAIRANLILAMTRLLFEKKYRYGGSIPSTPLCPPAPCTSESQAAEVRRLCTVLVTRSRSVFEAGWYEFVAHTPAKVTASRIRELPLAIVTLALCSLAESAGISGFLGASQESRRLSRSPSKCGLATVESRRQMQRASVTCSNYVPVYIT